MTKASKSTGSTRARAARAKSREVPEEAAPVEDEERFERAQRLFETVERVMPLVLEAVKAVASGINENERIKAADQARFEAMDMKHHMDHHREEQQKTLRHYAGVRMAEAIRATILLAPSSGEGNLALVKEALRHWDMMHNIVTPTSMEEEIPDAPTGTN